MRKRSAFRLLLPVAEQSDLDEVYPVILSRYEVSLLVKLLEYATRSASYALPHSNKFDLAIDREKEQACKEIALDLEGVLLMAKILDLSALNNLVYLRCLCGPDGAKVELLNDEIMQHQLETLDGSIPSSAACVTANTAFFAFWKVTESAAEIVDTLTDYAMATGVVTAAISGLFGALLAPAAIGAIASVLLDVTADMLTVAALQRLWDSRAEIVCTAYRAMRQAKSVKDAVFRKSMELQLGPVTSQLLSMFYTDTVLKQLVMADTSGLQESFINCTLCEEENRCVEQTTELSYYRKDIVPERTICKSDLIDLFGENLVIASLEIRRYIGPPVYWTEYTVLEYVGGGVGMRFEVPSEFVGQEVAIVAKGGGTVTKVCFVF